MKKKLSILLISSLFIALTSCEKDEMITDIERLEQEIITVVQTNNITKCSIIVDGYSNYSDVDFSIENGLIKIKYPNPGGGNSEIGYNLINLSHYSLSADKTYMTFLF